MCPAELRPIPPTARDHVAGPVTPHPRSATRGLTHLPLSRCSSTSAGRSYTRCIKSPSRIILTGAVTTGRLCTPFSTTYQYIHTFLFSSSLAFHGCRNKQPLHCWLPGIPSVMHLVSVIA
jgi:hypothetical protein